MHACYCMYIDMSGGEKGHIQEYGRVPTIKNLKIRLERKILCIKQLESIQKVYLKSTNSGALELAHTGSYKIIVKIFRNFASHC